MTAQDEEDRFAQLWAAFESGRYAFCVELAGVFLDDYPTHGVAWSLLGLAYARLSRYDDARRALRRAVQHVADDNVAMPFIWLGDLYLRKGDSQRAERWYRRATSARPDLARGHMALGELLLQRGDLDAAEAAFEASRATRDHDPFELLLHLGITWRAQGRYEDALSVLREARALDPESARALIAIEDVEAVFQLRRARTLRLVPAPEPHHE